MFTSNTQRNTSPIERRFQLHQEARPRVRACGGLSRACNHEGEGNLSKRLLRFLGEPACIVARFVASFPDGLKNALQSGRYVLRVARNFGGDSVKVQC